MLFDQQKLYFVFRLTINREREKGAGPVWATKPNIDDKGVPKT